jgi:hypothetical protein
MQRIATRQHASMARLAQTGARVVHPLPLVPTLHVDAMLEQLADALEMAQAAQEAAP